MEKPLNLNQTKVLDIFVGNGRKGATDAYQQVYQCKRSTAKAGGSRLVKSPMAISYMSQKSAAAAERAELSEAWILRNLKSVAERCMQAEPIIDKDGNPTGLYRFNATGALKALELLGGHIGMAFTASTEKAAQSVEINLQLPAKGKREKAIEGETIEVESIELDGDGDGE